MDEKPKNGQLEGAVVYELAGLVTRLAAGLFAGLILMLLLTILVHLLTQAERDIPAQLGQLLFFALPVFYHRYFWTRRDEHTPGNSPLASK